MRGGLLLRYLAREARGLGRRLLFFVLSLTVGVTAVVAVAGLSTSLRQALAAAARELLAADLAVGSPRPLPPELDAVLAGFAGVERTDTVDLATMAAAPGGTTSLVELRAVGPGYPFYGALVTAPAAPLATLLGDDGVILAEAALARLGVAVGDELRLGGESFVVRAVLSDEPDRALRPFSFAPRALVSLAGLQRTGLVAHGSRISFRALLRLAPDSDAATLAAAIERDVPDSVYLQVETAAEAQPGLAAGIVRVERYLGLVALLSLLVGGVGVAQAVRSWLATRTEAIATLRCLGLRPREVAAIYLGQTALLGLASSAAGCALGLVVQWAVPQALGDVLAAAPFTPWQPAALLRGVGVGLGVAFLFSLQPVLAAARVPPLAALQRAVVTPPASRRVRLALAVAAAGGLVAAALVQAGEARLALAFAGGVLATTLGLGLAAAAVTRAIGRLPRQRLGPTLRHGLAALARPGADTAAAVVALGLGALVILVMVLVEGALADQLDGDLAAGTPSTFFVDVQPEQLAPLESLAGELGATGFSAVPVIIARLRAVDGVAVAELTGGEGGDVDGGRWALTREQRLTSLAELADDNVVVAGRLWSDPARDEVSVELEYAERIGARLGSVLRFDVQGVPVEVVVSSLREVEWRSFRINFFLVVEPGVLDRAPHSFLAAASVPRDDEARLSAAVAAAFPNVNSVQVREALEKISAVLSRLGLGVRFLGSFTALAGIAILAGAASAAAVRRGREVALLKTLGVTRAGVAAMIAVEYGLVGLVAGAVGAAGGLGVSWAALVHGLDLPFAPSALALPATALGTALLTVVAGLAACAPALRKRPLEALREL